MASNQLSNGSSHDGEPQVEAYITYPPDKSTTNGILLITDAMGHKFINSQLIADQFAAKGYFVVMPDMFGGDAVPVDRPMGFKIMNWVTKHSPAETDPIISAVIKEMRDTMGCERIGGVGYGFGGKYVCRYLRPGLLDVGFIAHPSMLEGDELSGIDAPLSIAAAVRDFVFVTTKRRECEVILDKLEVPHQISLFSEVEHGFAVRSDLSKHRQTFAKKQAFHQAVAWFDHYLKVY
ncbi:hypothetical protein N7466_007741 [Penicillium verhagenii]|uniref:uncharacterized protein n=1 Tax=Penicillium verhagenii TaxID=1562060 RepID=UPI0025456BA0|nr:uncharacterized protein N7466_007741 [Penicillium verhagenii]KAJ5928785.1 hypothetical protein N7466_007741 [Penicillium verhagenii]